MITNLLDTIKTKQNEHMGVIDYASKKYVIFYDLTHCFDPAMRMLIILWRLNEENYRFSVFCKTMFPDIDIPDPIVIPHLGIENRDDMKIAYVATKTKFKSISSGGTNPSYS